MGTFGFIWCCLPIGPLGFLLLPVLIGVLYFLFPWFRKIVNACIGLLVLAIAAGLAQRFVCRLTGLSPEKSSEALASLLICAGAVLAVCVAAVLAACALWAAQYFLRERKAKPRRAAEKEWTEYRRRKEEERVRRRTEILCRRRGVSAPQTGKN